MPNLLERLALAVKKAGRMVWSGTGGINTYGSQAWWYNNLRPGEEFNYELEAGDLWRNSAVMATLSWITRSFPEARLDVCRKEGGIWNPIDDHPLPALLENPNPYYGYEELFAGTLLSWFLDGNCYWMKVRDPLGRLRELWWIPHMLMFPQWPLDGSAYISHYIYHINGHNYPYPVTDIIHFRHGFDPNNDRLGLSGMKSVLREVATDNLASQMSAALMRNLGVPGVVISPKDAEQLITQEEALAIKAKFKRHFTGEGRGDPLVNSIPLQLDVPAFSPDQLTLDKIRNIPEERITAVLGVPAVVVGLGAGLDRSTFSNVRQMRQAAYENCLKPTQRAFARFLTKNLLPEVGDAKAEKLLWCYDDVPAFADERQALAEEQSLLYLSGLVKRSEARARLKLPSTSEDNDYYEAPEAPDSPGDTARRPKPKPKKALETAAEAGD